MIDNILLILLILILAAKIIGSLFERIGLDSTIGELLTGIILGPSVLRLISPDKVADFAVIGSVLILFIAGMKQQDIDEIYKDKHALNIGITLLFATLAAMGFFFYLVPPLFGLHLSIIQCLVFGLAFAIVDIGVPAKILISKGLIKNPVGKITVRSAIVNIIAGLILFTIITIVVNATSRQIALTAGGIILFLVLTVLLIVFLSRISKYVMRLHIEEAEFSLAIILVLALAYITEAIGFSSVLGAFIAGVIVAKMPFAETRSFSDKVKSISFGLFVPLFFVWFGLEINLGEIWHQLFLALLIFVAYIIIRFTITYVYLRRYRFEFPAMISSTLLSVDVESLVVLIIAIRLGIFGSQNPLTLFAPSVFLSTLLIVLLVAIFSRIEAKRQIMTPLVKAALKKKRARSA